MYDDRVYKYTIYLSNNNKDDCDVHNDTYTIYINKLAFA